MQRSSVVHTSSLYPHNGNLYESFCIICMSFAFIFFIKAFSGIFLQDVTFFLKLTILR